MRLPWAKGRKNTKRNEKIVSLRQNISIMKRFQTILIVIPLICALWTLMGYGKIYGYGVSALCGIILCLAYGRNIKKDAWLIVAAFLLSMIGDWFLINRKGIPVRFIYGIIFYFMAHLGYLWFSLKNGKIRKWILSCTLLVYLSFFLLIIFPTMDSTVLTAAVLCYLLVSCISFAAATGIRFPTLPKWLFIAGITFILISDTIIAFKEFAGYNNLNFLIMPTYYFSHIMMTLALVRNVK